MSNHKIPSLRLLMGFEAAARHGNFSRAADELCLSQSAVSHQVQQLEEQLGQPLFRRLGRGVELTVAGEVLQRSVQRSVDTLRSGLGRIATYLDPGLVTLVAPAPLLHGWLMPRIGALREAVPGLCPLLSCDESARFVDEIDVDIVISDRPLPQTDLQQQPLLTDTWVTVASRNVAARLLEVPFERHPEHVGLVCSEQDMTGEQTAAVFRGPLADFARRAIFDDTRLVLDAVERGVGIACLSQTLADGGLRAGTLVELPGYERSQGMTWWISRVAGEPRSPYVAQFFDWLAEQGAATATETD